MITTIISVAPGEQFQVKVNGTHIGQRPTYRAAAALAAREVRRLGGMTQQQEKDFWTREAERIVEEQMRAAQ